MKFSDLPEVAHVYDPTAPQVVPGEIRELTPASFTEDKYSAEPLYRTYRDAPMPTPVGGQPGKQRICGLQRPVFITSAVLSVFLIIGTVIGLAVGLTAGKRNASLSPGPSPTAGVPGVESNLLPNTSLAAANWTDPAGFMHLYVFYQDASKELLTSVWDSENKSWATQSISQSLISTGLSLNLIPGTPLAAFSYTNPGFQIRVYAMTVGNSIHELLTPDPSLATGWKQGQLGSETSITAGEGSNLAALRPQCGTETDCQNNFPEMAIAYQDDSAALNVAKASTWEPQEIGPASKSSVIGLCSVIRNGNITDIGWRLTYDEDGTLREFTSEEQLTDWTRGVALGPVTSQPTDTNLAAFSYDLVDIMIISMQQDGGTTVRIWDSNAWVVNQTPTFGTAPQELLATSTFSAIAGNPQKRIYGVVNGTIHEWEFASRQPLEWRYIGTVSTIFEKGTI